MKNLYKIENELYIVDNTKEINKDTKTCWCIDISCNELVLYQGVLPSYHYKHYKKIIMTTDKSTNVLCSCGKDCGAKESGVQAIDDDFLEWFVKNPSCKEIENKVEFIQTPDNLKDGFYYKIIIPKEKPLQETLKEVAVNFVLKHFLFPNELFFKMSKCSQNDYLLEEEFGLDNTTKYREILGFIDGVKWQQERMYSEEEVRNLFKKYQYDLAQWVLRMEDDIDNKLIPVEWFEQNKKK